MPPSSPTPRGFRAFYREHYGFVWASVRRLGVPTALVDDAVQDTFVVAYRRRSELRGSARPWLYGVARGVASNYRRTARRVQRKRKAIAHASSPHTPSREPHVLLHDLDRFLDELPDRDRELFVLSEVEGLTGPELAQALGCNKSTAYGRVRTLRQRFARHARGDEMLEQERERRPRATAQGWAVLVPYLRGAEAGWLGLGTTGTSVVAAGLGGTVAAVVMGAVVLLSPSPKDAEASGRGLVPASVAAEREGSREQMPATVSPSPDSGSDAADAPSPLPLASSVAEPSAPERSSSHEPVFRASVGGPGGPSPTPDALAEENALLRRATRALADGDPAAALEATELHAERFETSALADLRAALRIEALCAQGKGAQARGEARAWAAAHPESPTRHRILDACSAHSAAAGQDTG